MSSYKVAFHVFCFFVFFQYNCIANSMVTNSQGCIANSMLMEMNGIKLTCFSLLCQAVFVRVRHNHGLDWCCSYQKLWLCFARHTSYGGYGNWPRGARIIEITQQPFFIKSWIRMEDNVVHNSVILSP